MMERYLIVLTSEYYLTIHNYTCIYYLLYVFRSPNANLTFLIVVS